MRRNLAGPVAGGKRGLTTWSVEKRLLTPTYRRIGPLPSTGHEPLVMDSRHSANASSSIHWLRAKRSFATDETCPAAPTHLRSRQRQPRYAARVDDAMPNGFEHQPHSPRLATDHQWPDGTSTRVLSTHPVLLLRPRSGRPSATRPSGSELAQKIAPR